MNNNEGFQTTSASRTAKNETEQRAKIFAALSDPTRLRIVELLALGGEISGSEIANQVGISLALFCHHSRTLIEAGLLQTRKDGQTKYNSLNRELLVDCLGSLKGLADNMQEVD
ncbi:ArsR/SmtB family transcription factor [Argonema antarcticum]|uniref:ArsR/SmtB family transcription factor n=1 Tax=Argonema antarcticum TaxID=2942763 RepID=UPI002011D229|nr:metalloregulator ArsR/SmtB family transcription factor [Argonema antarcticum]MCL1474692.1 metalloregulator ArsR/SmtB family transcription factor [Argonema antarcticum A004/B2]